MGKALMMMTLFCGACGGATSTGGTTGAGSTAAIGQDCASRCANIAADCAAPANVAESSCAELCATDPSSAQLDCLSGESCAALERLMKDGTPLCGLGGGTTGGGATCTPVETNDEACPVGCTSSYNVTGVTFCTASCSRDSDCPSSEGAPYKCFGGMCLISCQDDGPCAGGPTSAFTYCNLTYEVCE